MKRSILFKSKCFEPLHIRAPLLMNPRRIRSTKQEIEHDSPNFCRSIPFSRNNKTCRRVASDSAVARQSDRADQFLVGGDLIRKFALHLSAIWVVEPSILILPVDPRSALEFVLPLVDKDRRFGRTLVRVLDPFHICRLDSGECFGLG